MKFCSQAKVAVFCLVGLGGGFSVIDKLMDGVCCVFVFKLLNML